MANTKSSTKEDKKSTEEKKGLLIKDEKLNRYIKIAGAILISLAIIFLVNALIGNYLKSFFSTVGIIVSSFIIAYILSILLEPIMELLNKMGIKNVNVRSSIVSVFFLAFVVLLVVLIVVPAIKSIISSLESGSIVDNVKNTYQSFLRILPSFLSEYLNAYTSDIGTTLTQIEMAKVYLFLGKTFGGIAKVLITIVYTFLFLFFMLKERNKLIDSFEAIIPKKYIKHYDKLQETSEVVFREYIKGYFTVIFILFLMSFITFLIIGVAMGQSELVKYAIVFALILALTDLIPYIGPWIGGAIVLVISALTIFNLGVIMVIVTALVVFQMIEGLILQPFIMGNRVQVHPLGIFTAMIVFASLGLGVLGIILAAPITSLIKLTFRYYRDEAEANKAKEKSEAVNSTT